MNYRSLIAMLGVIGILGTVARGDGWKEIPPHKQHPKSIVYVCDASDSMVPKIKTLRQEFASAIDDLQPAQSYDIMFMRSKGCAQLSDHLLAATPESRQKGKKFVDDFKAGGKTDPLPAIEAAFVYLPERITLLGDHDFPDCDKLLARIRELNKAQMVQVDTIVFLGDGDTDTKFQQTLMQIAKENNGIYKYVKESDLKK